MTIRIGLGLPQLGEHVTPTVIKNFCTRAEELGYGSLWVQEHLFYPTANSSGYAGRQSTAVHPHYKAILGATELLGFAAACTERALIGTSVFVAGYHRPVELAQRISTLDVLSEGRLVAGFGAGWSDEEHAQLDVDPRTRGKRMGELIEALQACWADDPIEYHGPTFDIPTAIMRPKPVQRPHPPLLSGLRSEAGMRRTAKYFDIWNPSRGTAEQLQEQLAQMNAMRPDGKAPLRLSYRSYTQRPTDEIGGGGQGLEGVLVDLRTAIDAGAEELIVDTSFSDDMSSPEAWEQVPDLLAPLLEEAAAAGSAAVPAGAGR